MITLIIGLLAGGFIGYAYKDEISNAIESIRSLKHPVPKMDKSKTWKYDMFLETKTIIQAGYWMRKMHSFWELETNLNKIWLYGDRFAGKMLDIENIILGKKDILSQDDIKDSFNLINANTSGKVKNVYITSVNDYVYDKLLQSSLIYVNFYDCVASNTIVECISSQTPILVNKLPSVVEYLGEDYPLYFRDINHASSLSNNSDKILEAHEYLKTNTKLIDQLNIEKFIDSFYKECNKICKK